METPTNCRPNNLEQSDTWQRGWSRETHNRRSSSVEIRFFASRQKRGRSLIAISTSESKAANEWGRRGTKILRDTRHELISRTTDNYFANRSPHDRLLTDHLFAHGTSFPRTTERIKAGTIARESADTRTNLTRQCRPEGTDGPARWRAQILGIPWRVPPLGDDQGRIDFTTDEEWTFPRAFSLPLFQSRENNFRFTVETHVDSRTHVER